MDKSNAVSLPPLFCHPGCDDGSVWDFWFATFSVDGPRGGGAWPKWPNGKYASVSELSAIRYTAFKVIRSNIEIAIPPPRIDRSNIWYRVSSRLRRYIANVRGQRSNVKVTEPKVKVTA